MERRQSDESGAKSDRYARQAKAEDRARPASRERRSAREAEAQRKPSWNSRHHVIDERKRLGSKALPPPPQRAKETARNGGPIKPKPLHREGRERGRSRQSNATATSAPTVRGLAESHRERTIKTDSTCEAKPAAKSPKKKQELHIEIEDSNATSPRPGTGQGPARNAFTLDFPAEGIGDLEQSYDISELGTMTVKDFEITQSGITKTPSHLAAIPEKAANAHLQEDLIRLSALGRGASGVVYKALHAPTLTLVAVKDIPVYEQEKRHQMVTELQALYHNLVSISAGLGFPPTSPCPHIVAFYDAFINVDQGNISIIVEYMDGGSLQDIVDTGGCSHEGVLANISFRILTALAFLDRRHQIHRDIKPSNLLINHMGDVKLSDFGIVRDMENSMAKANTFVGTLTYMSPERISGEQYDSSCDVWSLGLSIMTCALGEFPISTSGGYWGLLHALRDEPPPQLPADRFSEDFCDFITKCCAKKDRPSAERLLRHPFVSGCTLPPPADPEDYMMEGDSGSETARSELDNVMHQLKDFYPEGLKKIEKHKLNSLAMQLGLPIIAVRQKISSVIPGIELT